MRYSTLLFILFLSITTHAQPKVVLIRHAEKPASGFNLTCQGLNRSLQLPAVLVKNFGLPTATYVPALGLGDTTKHARMFQTLIPFAAKYNLIITSKYEEDDSTGIARDILKHKGTVLVAWEHKKIVSIAHALGIKDDLLKWRDDDYDSIWIITFANGEAHLTKEKEGLNPSPECPF